MNTSRSIWSCPLCGAAAYRSRAGYDICSECAHELTFLDKLFGRWGRTLLRRKDQPNSVPEKRPRMGLLSRFFGEGRPIDQVFVLRFPSRDLQNERNRGMKILSTGLPKVLFERVDGDLKLGGRLIRFVQDHDVPVVNLEWLPQEEWEARIRNTANGGRYAYSYRRGDLGFEYVVAVIYGT